jgi:hypothetical protein
MKYCLFLLCILFLGSLSGGQVKPADGFVPNSETAVKIAEAVLIPVYGRNKIESEQPFSAALKGNTWTVDGTLYCPDGKGGRTTVHCKGGVAIVEIAKADGRILSMWHYR